MIAFRLDEGKMIIMLMAFFTNLNSNVVGFSCIGHREKRLSVVKFYLWQF